MKNLPADSFPDIEGLFCFFIFNQFEGPYHTDESDVTNKRQRSEFFEGAVKYRDKGFYFLQCFFLLEDFEGRQSGGTADWVCGIGMAVIKGFELFIIVVKGVVDFVGCQGRSERERSGSYSLCEADKIRLDRGVLTGKHFTRAAKAGGDFVKD